MDQLRRRPAPPFVRVHGRTYLNVAFTLPPPGDVPPLPELLAALLRHTVPADILLLRALTRHEQALLTATLTYAEHEAWAQVVVCEADLYRPQK